LDESCISYYVIQHALFSLCCLFFDIRILITPSSSSSITVNQIMVATVKLSKWFKVLKWASNTVVKLKSLASWIFLSFTSFWRNFDSYEYKHKSARRGAQFVPKGAIRIKDKKIHEARDFNFTYRYIDDVLSINNSRFAEFLPLIYPPELEVKEFTIWKSIVYNLFCRDGIYFDKILVSEYKLFKRSNKANLFIALGWRFIYQ
jgi:hypothetical protein